MSNSLINDIIINQAYKTIEIEAQTVSNLTKCINSSFVESVRLIYDNKGRLVVTGIGKSAIIAKKIVATFNSTGTPAIFLHAADAIHGDIGIIQQNDIVLILSKSGDTSEIKALIPYIKRLNIPIIALVSNLSSFLAKSSDRVIHTQIDIEACPHNLAPSASTTAQMVMGDALAFCVLKMKGFTKNDFANLHPGGILGKQLFLTIGELCSLNDSPSIQKNASVEGVILEMTSKRMGATAVIDCDKNLLGIITDGDLRRMLFNGLSYDKIKAKDIMNASPKYLSKNALAIDAFEMMRKNSITQIIVLEEDKSYLGMVHIHDIIKEGLHFDNV